MSQKKYNIVVDSFLCIFIFAIIGISLIKTIFFPKNVNEYENRKANRILKFSFQNFYDSNFQNSMESALADQILFTTTMKKNYNLTAHSIINKFYENLEKNLLKGKYINLNGIYRIGGTDNLVYKPYKLNNYNELNKKIDNLNTIIKSHPELKFYLYYIEKDTDINFETNEKLGASEYITQRINETNIISGIYKINDFEEFKRNFYKTDHHWNYDGSYKAYKEILAMILPGEKCIEPSGTLELKSRLIGSKAYASGLNDMFSEEFIANLFEIPSHRTLINGKDGEYGNEEKYRENLEMQISYAMFYGDDNGEVEFDFYNPDRENLLIIGESYDNAIIKLLASHFNKTYDIDLRSYEQDTGEKFKFDEYVKQKSIDKVLFIGNIDYYMLDTFLVEE